MLGLNTWCEQDLEFHETLENTMLDASGASVMQAFEYLQRLV